MSEAERPVEPRANAPRRRRAHRPAGPGADSQAAAGQSADRGSGQRSGRQRTGGQRADGQRVAQGEKSPSKQNRQGGQNQASAQAGQAGQAGPPAEGQARQGRRRRRGGRGRRGGTGQDGAADNQRQNAGSDAGESTATHTVKSGDGTAGATSARQTPRHARNQNRSRSSSGGQAASANTTRTSAPGKAGAKSGGKSGSKPNGRAGAKAAGTKVSGGKNPRGGRGGGRSPRGGQRLRTVLETSAGGLVVRGLAQAAAAGTDPDLSRLEVALIGRLDRRGRMLWSMPKGHIEPGETIAETARREVLEETGVDGTVLAPLGIIDYWFVAEGRRIHKTVHHHLIRYDHGDLCDEDPEITEVAWVAFDDLPRRLAYPDERRLVESARSLLPGLARGELAGQAPEALPSQVVDPSRRSGGPEPVRRSGGGARATPPRNSHAPGDPPRDSRPRGNAPEESGS